MGAGAALMARWRYLRDWAWFAARLVAMATFPSAYNHAVREVLSRQLFFTAWEVLGGIAVFSGVFTGLVAHMVAQVAQPFGLQLAGGELVLRLVALEAVPLGVALFVALRTSAAMNAEVALMSQRGEAAAWQRLGLDPVQLEYLPRLVGGVISLLALTLVAVGVSVAVLQASVVYSPAWHIALAEWWPMMAQTFTIAALLGLVFKSLAFGLIVTTLPLFEGAKTPAQPHMVPVSVLRGMVRVFVGVVVVWLVWWVLRYV
jgi:phospholipid/cholesterol/gamma-HCH transport system permease protein